MPLATVPGQGTKLLMLSSGKQGLTVPAEPSPAESQLGAATRASQSTKCTLCFHCASSRCLLGPSRSQDLSQGSVESRGREERSCYLCKVELAFPWQPQLGGWSSLFIRLLPLDLSLVLCKTNRCVQ